MSSYLQFKKNDTEICSFSRSTKVYQFFDKYSEDWKELTERDLEIAIQNADGHFDDMQNYIKNLKLIYDKLTNYEELEEMINRIDEAKTERYEIVQGRIQLELINNILFECDKDDKMYWRVC